VCDRYQEVPEEEDKVIYVSPTNLHRLALFISKFLSKYKENNKARRKRSSKTYEKT